MFDAVRNHQKIMLGLVLLLIFPAFVFFGLSDYGQTGGGGDDVAVVGDQKIPRQAFEQAHRQQVERLQQMLGGQVDAKMFDTPAARAQTLEGLITQQALLTEARSKHITVPPADIQKAILGIEGLNGEDGKFDFSRYQTLLAQQNMTPAMFEAQIGQDLTLQQLADSVQNSAIVPKTVVDRLYRLQESQRTVRTRFFDPKDFETGINPTDEQIAKYYEDNPAAYQVPEAVDVEYVTLDRAALAAGASVTDADLKAFYEQNKAQFSEPEQRQAAHILVAAGADANDAAKAAAREKADKLSAQLKAAPDKFAELAKTNSDDSGSAEQGGDLGFFSADMMVKPFSDAAFAMKEGEISEPVQSEYGWHIIKVTGSKGSGASPFEEVKPQLESLYRQQEGAKRFTELAESFANTVYEQSDSLQPAASKFSLELKKGERLQRAPGTSLAPDSPLRNQRLLDLIWGEEAMQNKRNTEAIEVAPGVMVSARVAQHHPATRLPLAEVKDQVKAQLIAAEAASRAKAEGEKLLVALKDGLKAGTPATGTAETGTAEPGTAEPGKAGADKAESALDKFSPPVTVTRADPKDLAPPVVAEIFKLPADPLPTYVGTDLGAGGYQVVRLEQVTGPAAGAEDRRQMYQEQVQRVLAQTAVSAYVEQVKSRTSIERNLAQ